MINQTLDLVTSSHADRLVGRRHGATKADYLAGKIRGKWRHGRGGKAGKQLVVSLSDVMSLHGIAS